MPSPSVYALSAVDSSGKMEGEIVEENEKKFVRKRSGKAFKSREHGKGEKRKQRKAWLKRKREAKRKPEQESRAEDAPYKDFEIEVTKRKESTTEQRLSRGKMLVELAKKRKPEDDTLKVTEPATKRMRAEKRTEEKPHPFKEVDRELLTIDESSVVGSGTFGSCFSAVYRSNLSVLVKVIKTKDSSRARQEVIHEAEVIANLGDHSGIPHLFGVCIDKAPFYLVLQQHTVEGNSLTLSKAVATGFIKNTSECIKVLKEICEALMFVHNRGYLHNDLKGNNVVLEGSDLCPVVIDFGKSRKIKKAKFLKPKLNPKEASRLYPHIAPELHRGERQTTSSDVYSFGALISRALKVGKFDIPALKNIAKKCLATNPKKRPKLAEVLQKFIELMNPLK